MIPPTPPFQSKFSLGTLLRLPLTILRCTLDRPSGASPTGRMYIVNHFLDLQVGSILIPDDPADSTTNSASSIEAQANLCNGMYGHMPNGVLVDYFNVGKYSSRFMLPSVEKIVKV
jgi:hypothetical protein